MKKIVVTAAIAASFTLAPSAIAQSVAPVATQAEGAAVLRVGTEVPLKLSEELTTKGKKLKVGHRFNLAVADNVMVGDRIALPAGTPAVGEVTEVRNKGMWGKSGHITARVLYALLNGRQIRLTGNFDDKGTTGTAGVVGAAVVLPVAGFFLTGTSATLPVNMPVKGFIDEDVALAPTPPAPSAN